MVYGTYNYSIHGVYKPSYNWGAPPCTGVKRRQKRGSDRSSLT